MSLFRPMGKFELCPLLLRSPKREGGREGKSIWSKFELCPSKEDVNVSRKTCSTTFYYIARQRFFRGVNPPYFWVFESILIKASGSKLQLRPVLKKARYFQIYSEDDRSGKKYVDDELLFMPSLFCPRNRYVILGITLGPFWTTKWNKIQEKFCLLACKSFFNTLTKIIDIQGPEEVSERFCLRSRRRQFASSPKVFSSFWRVNSSNQFVLLSLSASNNRIRIGQIRWTI